MNRVNLFVIFSWGIIVYAKEFELEGLLWEIANLVHLLLWVHLQVRL